MDILTVQALPTKSQRNPNGVQASDVVEGVLNDLGQERISYGHWSHSLFRYWFFARQYEYWFGGFQFKNGFKRL